MRKSQDKLLISPRPKLQLKSPIGRQKLKISSPIHSTRSLIGKTSSNKKIQQSQTSQLIVWIPNHTHYSFIHPLQRIEGNKINFCLSISKKNFKNKIWVVSGIDSFIETYMELNDQMKIECQKWFIISNAVNSRETQIEFNQLYTPIQFLFLPTVSSVCNQMLNYTSNTIFRKVQKILDLSLASSSQFMSIQQTLIESIVGPHSNYLYILNDAKQWIQFSRKMNSSIQPYFITGSEQIKQGKISVKQPEVKNKQLIFILFHFERNIQNIEGFNIFQQNYCKRLLDQKLIERISIKNEVYLQKVIQKLIIPAKKVCIFAEPLSRSALIQISQIRQKFSKQYIILQYSLYKQGDTCYKLKWNTKTRSCKQFTINAAMTITEQIKKIQSFINSKIKIEEQLRKQSDKLRKMQIFLYTKQRDRSYKHCITSALEKCSIKYNILENLQYLVQTHKITIIYGFFTYAEVKSLNNFYNVFLVPINKQSQQVAPFNQIQQSNQFMDTAIKSYNKIYGQIQSVPVQAYVHVLYQTQTQLPTILKSVSIPQQLLKTHYIPNFHLEFVQFREYSKHVVIAPMDIFQQQLENKIKQFQWKFNRIVIDVYLLYGQQFIYRNKQGNYKFFKSTQLQQKINQLQQYCQIKQKQKQKQIKIQQPNLQNLNQVDNMKINDQLDDLRAEQSIVECYINNRQNINNNQYKKQSNMNNHEYYNTQCQDLSNKNSNGSLIHILNDSSSKISLQNSQIKNNNHVQFIQNNNIELNYSITLGGQTQKLMEQTCKKQKQNSDNIKLQNTLKNQQYQFSANIKKKQIQKYKKYSYNKQSTPNRQKFKSPRQKSTYIKQFKQYHHPIKTNPTSNQLNQQQHHDELNSSGPEFYKLYIFIHRSVPHYSLVRRSQKDYHILLYTRLQEILVFARYLKPQQKIFVIANDQSAQIYGQLIAKSGIEQNKLKIIFNKDLSQNYIRNQIDRILSEQKLQQNKQKIQSKKFKALIVYAANNERVLKAIKIVRKIFGPQIKLVFLKQKQYDQMIQNRFKLKINNGISVYKVGLNAKPNQISITSIRSLFILAMHPDLKNHGFQFKNLSFSLQSYIGRLIYSGADKDYVLTQKNNKPGPESLRKKLQGIKSQKKLLPFRQNYFSKDRGQSTEHRRGSSLRYSNLSRSSTALYRSSSIISIIVSQMLKQNISSKNIFSCQQMLYQQIMLAHFHSRLAIVVITQKQFDMYDLFQTKYFEQATKQVIWVIETKTEGKQIFVGPNIVYSLAQNIKQAVQMIIKQYQNQIYFQQMVIQSKVQDVKNGHYGQQLKKQLKSQYCRTLYVYYFNKLSQDQLRSLSNENNKLVIILSKDKILKKVPKNVIQFPSLQSMGIFNQTLIQIFENKTEKQYPNIGSILLTPEKHIQKINKIGELCLKKDLLYKSYDGQIFSTMISYSIFRVLIVGEKQNENLIHLRMCPNIVQIDKNYQKMGKKLATILM